jgi:F0F1-type ATP synthase membrane subunit b/b'
MPALRRYLRRFRLLLAPPGRAAPAAVPRDARADARDELGDVLAAVDAIDREAGRILGAARDRAFRHRERARERAATITQRAEEEADGIRAAAAAEQRASLETALAAVRHDASEEAARVLRRGEADMDHAVERLVARVLAVEVDRGLGEVA